MKPLVAAALRELAPAKLNLSLHVTGRRPDGCHLLDSLVVFPRVGDMISVEPAGDITLKLSGPFAGGLGGCADNLVLRAARLLRPAGLGAAITLEKNLPVASGIGGGSADAAAALRLLARLWDAPLPEAAVIMGLGADVPVCLASQSCRMTGAGERLEPLDLPDFHVVLVNPGVPVPTGAVFNRLARADNPSMPGLPDFQHRDALFDFLAAQRNDLAPAAISVAPAISQALGALSSQPGCRLSRMSGSGATCFGLFARAVEAQDAEREIRNARPGWWVAAAPAGG